MKLPKSAPSKAKRGLAILQDSYPKLFSKKKARPLAVGVKEQILNEQTESKSAIRKALRFYCNNLTYLHSFEHYKHRFNLQGEPVEALTDEDKAYAAKKIAEIKANLAASKEAAKQSKTEE